MSIKRIGLWVKQKGTTASASLYTTRSGSTTFAGRAQVQVVGTAPLIIGEEGSSVTVPDGESLSITLFDAQAHEGYICRKANEHEEEFSVPLEANDNTLNFDTNWVEDKGIYLFPGSKEADFLFSGDYVLATLLKAVAIAGELQVVFDEVTLDGTQSQGIDGGPIVSHRWALKWKKAGKVKWSECHF